MLYYERAIILPYPSEAVNSALNGSAKYDSPYAARNVVNGGYQGVGVGVGTPLDSEETLKPETMTTMSSISVNTDASVGSLVGSVGSVKEKMLASQLVGSWGSSSLSGSPPVLGARVIRSVAAGRGKRSASAAPSLNGSIALSTSPSSTGSSML
ncbi:ubiquitin-specific protease ubp1, partial [Marasmius crinis-equi]